MYDIFFSLDLSTTKGARWWHHVIRNSIGTQYPIYTYGKTPKQHWYFPNIQTQPLHHYYIQNTYCKAPSKLVFYYPTPTTHLSIASHMNVP
jgi:hypothetical protein